MSPEMLNETDSAALEPVPLERRRVLQEVLGLYLGTLIAIKAVVVLQARLALPVDVLVLVPALFIYVPILWLRSKCLDSHHFGLTLEHWGRALKLNAVLFGAILPFFLIGNHYFQQIVFHRDPVGVFPRHLLTEVVAYHLFFVGFPEEFFYRGYVQSRLNQVFPKPFRLLGVTFGWGLVLTAVLFTVGHSIVVVRWWHFSILFPALVFGWIRERTGNILAGSLFHAGCNILMVMLDTWYGVIPP